MIEEKNQLEAEKKELKRKKKLKRWFRFLRCVYYSGVQLFVPIKRLGFKSIPDGPYIIVGNHLHVLDTVPIALASKQPVHFLAKNELSNKAIGRWFVKKSQCILVNRDGTDVRAVMQSMKYLKNGESISLFPEGSRNKTDEIFLPFKSGAATLAIRTKTPIIIMIQCKKIRLFHRNYFYFTEPFELTEYYDKKLTEEIVNEADEKLRLKMLELYHMLDEQLKNKKKKK